MGVFAVRDKEVDGHGMALRAEGKKELKRER